MKQDFSFADLFDDEDCKTIPVPHAHMHTCSFCGLAKEECGNRKKDPLPLEKAVQFYIEDIRACEGCKCAAALHVITVHNTPASC